MLAVVLVDEGLVVIAAAILGIVIESVDVTECRAQLIDVFLAHTVEIGPLPQLTLAIAAPHARPGHHLKLRHIAQWRLSTRD